MIPQELGLGRYFGSILPKDTSEDIFGRSPLKPNKTLRKSVSEGLFLGASEASFGRPATEVQVSLQLNNTCPTSLET